MKLPASLTTVTPISRALAFILFIFLPFLGFYLGYEYRGTVSSSNKDTVQVSNNYTSNPSTVNNQSTIPNSARNPITNNYLPAPVGDKCKVYGHKPREDFLERYTVQKNDSLLKIAQNKLGNVNRAGEIVWLNQDRYPQLWQNQFLEVGWTLILPPREAEYYGDNLILKEGVSGKIYEINDQYMGLYTSADAASFAYIYYSRSKEYSDISRFKIGDCITVIYSTHDASPISIELQN